MFTKKVSLLALAIVTTFLMGLSVMGQATTGTLRGTVVDSKGDAVAGATVKVKNEATGSESTSTTDGEGSFTANQLIPGPYTVSVEQSGFKRSVKTGIAVTIGQVTSASLSLETGAPSETVTVVASGDEALQTEQAQVTGTIDTRRVEELPSNGAGGGIDTLALLIPGVVANRTGGTNTNGTGLSVNGNRGRSNNFQIDGEDNNDLSVGGPALFVDFQDSVQEFQVVTNNFSAQYGRNQGAIVNIVTKTGTNDFHGTGFLFHRDNRNLNSLDNIERRSGQLKPLRDLYNVVGMTFGGPIVLPNFGENDGPIARLMKNRAFFFFGYQGVREPSNAIVRSASRTILPSEFSRLSASYPGNAVVNTIVNYNAFALGSTLNTFTSPAAGVESAFNLGTLAAGCPRSIAATAVAPVGCGAYTAYVNPATGRPFLVGGTYDVYNFGTAIAPNLFQGAQYEHAYDTTFFENYYQFRFDVRPSDKDNVSFRYINQLSSSRNANSSSNGFRGDLPASSKNLGGDWTHQISNSLVNTVRLSSQRIGVEFGGGCLTRTPGCIPAPADIDQAFTNIAFTGFTSVVAGGSLGTIGQATNLPQGRIGKVKQFADTVNWSTGKHSWTFGFEFKKLDELSPFLPGYEGIYTYSTASRVRNNAPSAETIAVGDPNLSFGEKDKYVFVQDDWKIRPNLTLNLGVRYENTGQPLNVLYDEALARESSSKPLYSPTLPLASRLPLRYPTDNNNFAPRVGFAWVPKFWKSILGEDATVIRGGYSIAYEPAFYNILLNNATNAPFAASLTIAPATLTDTPGSIYALPANPYGDTVRANAATLGVLPLGQLDPKYLAQVDADPNFYSPYSQQFSLGIQHQFGRKVIAEARYVGTHGVGLFQNINNNFYIRPLVNGLNFGGVFVFPSFSSFLPPGTVAQNCVNLGATVYINEAACDGRLKQNAGITTRNNGATSIYHSLQTRLNGRFFNDSLNLGATYTWSKSIDDASEIFGFADNASPNPQNPFCANTCERGLSAFDRPHVFTTNFVYDIPFMKEQRGVIGKLLGGWQVNAVYILTTGQVFTPSNGINALYGLGNTYLTAGDRPFAGNPNAPAGSVAISQFDAALIYGAPCSTPACYGFYSFNAHNANPTGAWVVTTPNDVRFIINGPGAAKNFGTPFGSLARGTERGPKFNNLNLSVFKNIKIAERFRLQLRGEAFNFLNHPNPGFGTGSGGSVPNASLLNAGLPGTEFHNNDDIELARRVVQVALRLIF